MRCLRDHALLVVIVLMVAACQAQLALSVARLHIATATNGSSFTYFAGGQLAGSGVATNVVDYIDWSAQPLVVRQLPSMSYSRREAAAVFTAGSLVVGGGLTTGTATPPREVERWDGSGAWQPLSGLLSAGRGLIEAATAGDFIVFAGGRVGSVPYANVDVFRVSTWSLFTTYSMVQGPGWGLSADAISGKIYLCGGLDSTRRPFSAVSVVDDRGTLAPGTSLVQARGDMASAVRGSQLVLYGGVDSNGNATSTSIIWDDVIADSFRTLDTGIAVTDAAGATAANGIAVFSGGRASLSTPPLNYVEIFDGSMWTPATSGLTVPRRDHSAIAVGNYVLFVGGSTGDVPTPTDSIEAYDTSTNQWVSFTEPTTTTTLAAITTAAQTVATTDTLASTTSTASVAASSSTTQAAAVSLAATSAATTFSASTAAASFASATTSVSSTTAITIATTIAASATSTATASASTTAVDASAAVSTSMAASASNVAITGTLAAGAAALTTSTAAVASVTATAMASASASAAASVATSAATSAATSVATTATSASVTSSGTPPTAAPGVLIVNGPIYIPGSWSAPPLVIFDGGQVIVGGTAYINRTAAEIDIAANHTTSETFRVPLVQAAQVVGGFGSVTVKHKAGGAKCHQDFVSSTDVSSDSLSVLITTRDAACKGRNPMLIFIIVVCAIGATLVVIGLLWVRREAAMTWARAAHDEEALVT